MKTEIIIIRVSKPLKDRIKQHAESKDISMSQLLILSIQEKMTSSEKSIRE